MIPIRRANLARPDTKSATRVVPPRLAKVVGKFPAILITRRQKKRRRQYDLCLWKRSRRNSARRMFHRFNFALRPQK